jgi:uncharacterized membrane protein YraQ (UPF0718 family)
LAVKNAKRRPALSGKYFFLAVLAAYLLSGLFDPGKTADAFDASLQLLLSLLPLFAVIIVLTALINRFLKPKALARYLGSQSGVRGWLLALLAGIISHGPMYAWYPMLQELKTQGLGNGLITVFLYARAVKLPLLPIMVDYFGLFFTLILMLYIVLGALIQGKLVAWMRI